MDFETQPQVEDPKITKKVVLIILFIIIVFSFGLMIIQFAQTEWRDFKNKIYQEGLTMGANQLYSLEVRELFSTGQLKINIPATGDNYDINGTGTKQIILKPTQ